MATRNMRTDETTNAAEDWCCQLRGHYKRPSPTHAKTSSGGDVARDEEVEADRSLLAGTVGEVASKALEDGDLDVVLPATALLGRDQTGVPALLRRVGEGELARLEAGEDVGEAALALRRRSGAESDDNVLLNGSGEDGLDVS